jgi:catechol 2,3-dioxygenase-like lactoylglutathione lyase family enzyme
MNPHIETLSHVGIQTSDLDASLKFYTEVLGLEEAFRLERDGRVTIIYLHATQNTFVELFAPRPDQGAPPKTHFSFEVADIDAAVEDILKRLPPESVRNAEPATGIDGSRLFNFFDPDGHRIEFQQFPPDSEEAQAMGRWEPG